MILKFKVSDEVSESQLGVQANDDCASFVESPPALFAWVIDGATSVADRPFLDTGSGDPAWFAQSLSEALRRRASNVSSRELHALAVADVAAAYDSMLGQRLQDVPTYARPSASVTIVRIEGERAEFFYLGDCPAFSQSEQGRVIRISDQQPTDGEAALRERVKRTQSIKDVTPKQMFQEQLAWLQAQRQRQLRSRPLNVSAAISGAHFGGWECTVDTTQMRALVLMSDGYERFSAQYSLGSEAEMVDLAVRDGAMSVLQAVRRFERDDADCRKTPRLKASDDATCLVLTRS